MDPSSFASAAASLLGLAIQVTGLLYGDWDYSSRVLAERLIYELSQLRNVLQSLEVTALFVTEAVIVPKDLIICLEDVRRRLIWLGSRLLRQDNPAAFSFQNYELPWRSINAPRPPQATKLPITPVEALGDVQYLQDRLSRLRNNIENSTFSSSEELLPKRTVDPTGTLWRDCAEYTKPHELARSSRVPDTGLWFVSHPIFRRWLVGEHVSNTLFCPGLPGSGKTVLTSLAIAEVQKWQQDSRSSNTSLAYFYFSYRTPTPLRNVALALLEQLYLQSLSPVDELTELEAHAAKLEYIPLSRIVSVLLAVSRRFQKTYIIFDALDECPPDYQHDLLRLLTSIRDSPTRLFTSSRPYQTFDIFDSSPQIDIKPSKEDIELYANATLQKAAILVGNELLLRRIIAALVETGEQHRMFLPIVFQVEAIRRKKTSKEIVQQLNELPRSLHAVYQDILNRIQGQESHMADLAKRTLTWLFYSQRPLKTVEILEIHRSSASKAPEIDASLLVKACMGLVQAGNTITFAHFSVKEFLEASPIGDEGILSLYCLEYLLSSNIDQATSPKSVDNHIETAPFLLYAASFWGRHLRNAVQKHGAKQESLKRLCSVLLKDKPRVASLCHIIFISRPRSRDSDLEHALVKSSWLHLVSYFGLDWAISPPIAEFTLKDKRDEWRRTPLHLAAENGFAECVEVLLKQMSQFQEDSDGRTVWHYVAMSGNPEAMRPLLFLSHTRRNSSQLMPSTSLGADKLGKSPLEYAAINGNAEAFRTLLSLYAPEFSNDFKVKAFSAALAGGKIDIVDCLLSQGLAPNYEHLLVATEAGFEEAVNLLLDYGIEVDNPGKGDYSALLIAAREGRNKILQFLIWNGADLERVSRDGHTALAFAVKMGNVEGVRILLQAGAKPEDSINQNDRLVVYAARQGMVEIVRQLRYAEVGIIQAAFAAAENGHVEVLQLLLESGLSANIKSDAGQSLMEAAREADHSAIVDLLHSLNPNDSPRVVYSVPSDAAFLKSEDSVDPKTPLDKATLIDKDAAASREPPLNKDIVSANERQEKQTSKSGQEEKTPFTKPTGEPIGETPRAILHTPQTKEVESKPALPQTLSRSKSGLVRSAGPRNSAVPFFLLSEPISTGKLDLGSIVADPKDPLYAFAPEDTSILSQLTGDFRSDSVQSHYETINQRTSTNSIALGVLGPILKFESTQSRSIAIKSPEVVRMQLHNHERVLSQILDDVLTRNEIFDMAKSTDRKQLFFIVGLLVASNLRTSIKEEAAGAGSAAFSKASEVTHSGDKIFAISYRVVKIRTRGFIRNLVGRASVPEGRDILLDNYFTPKAHDRLL